MSRGYKLICCLLGVFVAYRAIEYEWIFRFMIVFMLVICALVLLDIRENGDD